MDTVDARLEETLEADPSQSAVSTISTASTVTLGKRSNSDNLLGRPTKLAKLDSSGFEVLGVSYPPNTSTGLQPYNLVGTLYFASNSTLTWPDGSPHPNHSSAAWKRDSCHMAFNSK